LIQSVSSGDGVATNGMDMAQNPEIRPYKPKDEIGSWSGDTT